MEYPRTLAAARKAKNAEWELADALLKEIGPPSAGGRGLRDDAGFRECRSYLAAHGIEYSIDYLRDLRNLALRFIPDTRVSGITPRQAREAGSPEVLEAAQQMTGKQVPTQREIGKARKAVAKEARRSHGKTLPDRREAARRVAAATPPSELRRHGDVLGLADLASKAAASGRAFLSQVAGFELTTDERDELIEDITAVLDTWQAALDAVRFSLGDEAEAFLKGGA